MPFTHSVDAGRLLVTFALSGTLTTGEMLAAIDDVVRFTGPRRHNVLSDHRALTTPATTDQLKAVVSKLTEYPEVFAGIRWAIVVAKPASFGMMRVLSVLAEEVPIDVQVFWDLAEAERWLESPPPA